MHADEIYLLMILKELDSQGEGPWSLSEIQDIMGEKDGWSVKRTWTTVYGLRRSGRVVYQEGIDSLGRVSTLYYVRL